MNVNDPLGRKISELVHGRKQAGRHEIRLNTDGWVSGFYIYRIEAGSFNAASSMFLAN